MARAVHFPQDADVVVRVGPGAHRSATSLAVGASKITAIYSGDKAYAGSTSAPLTQTVLRAPTDLTPSISYAGTLARTHPPTKTAGDSNPRPSRHETGGQSLRPGHPVACSQRTGAPAAACRNGSSSSSPGCPGRRASSGSSGAP